ncbi:MULTISPECIES: cellulase family glycosylhydrolase [unclassified Frankia]|uniref:cellulase family glycosylhydrolase n=1 Tax=unclassified Frankia TaxID=2632575 RepID=UPI001EF6C159|nr:MULTISPECIES: cellulase family glycosylhydrolase [unclassified Frankia]
MSNTAHYGHFRPRPAYLPVLLFALLFAAVGCQSPVTQVGQPSGSPTATSTAGQGAANGGTQPSASSTATGTATAAPTAVPAPTVSTTPVASSSAGGSAGVAGARGRVQVRNNTVVTDQGTLLRAGTLWYLNYSSGASQVLWAREAATGEAFWATLTANNLNGVRVAVAYNEASDSPTMAQITSYLDKIIEKADAHGMYVMIDYHSALAADADQQYTIARLREFWSVIAPRYANRTNVLYELYNEPVTWRPADYTAQNIADQKEIYRLIRAKAPETHIIILSFAVPANYGGDSAPTMLSIASQFDGVVDWSKTSVGFHAYWETSSQPWVRLKASYPVISTEFMGPAGTVAEATSFDGSRWTTEVFERQGISWVGWNITDTQNDINTILPDLRRDATGKGYWWQADHGA